MLGLKSTMSQAELHIMAGRLQAAKLAAAERGELRAPLPVGLVYDEDGMVVTDPDAEVRAAVADVFACFAAAGSAYGVVAAFAGRKFPQRAYGGAWAGQLRWGPLTHHRVLQVLKNPAYACAYVHGRHVTRKAIDAAGNVRTVTAEVPRAQWKVLIKDHHPGYVTWEEYLAVEARLAANWTASGARTVREGSALCQGIIYCGSCGGPMVANYQGGDRANYECHSRRDGRKAPGCRGIATAPSMTPSPGCCWTRSRPSRSRSRSPPPTRSPASTSAPAAPPSWPSSGHATTRPRRAGLQPGRAREPPGCPHPGGPLGSQARRARRSRAGPGVRPRDAAAAPGPGQPGKDRR